jgi:uncharacterized repeat protein (TIGR03803 family)
MKYALCLFVLISSLVSAQRFSVIHYFAGPPADGSFPEGSLVADPAGNLYGTTSSGGSVTSQTCVNSLYSGCGTVFELSANSDGSWTEQIIYNFCSNDVGGNCLDGRQPMAGMVLDSAGNLYGTTAQGGNAICDYGCGIVFELSPPSASGSAWTETTLYTFCSVANGNNCLDGSGPVSQLIFDAAGNLYGTTEEGGSGTYGGFLGSGGTVFELSPGVSGWMETVLYNFCSVGEKKYCEDGWSPTAGVTFDDAGNLYGTTFMGGTKADSGGGTVFELSPTATGWQESVLLRFPIYSPYFYGPQGGVSFDSKGNLFGTVTFSAGGGFRLSPSGIERTFHLPPDGANSPTAGVFVDRKTSTVYATASSGAQGGGSVFMVGPRGKETVLHTFACNPYPACPDGAQPDGALIPKSGNLYGTTFTGGNNSFGVIYEIAP